MQLIDNKEDFIKFWSVKLGTAGTAVTGAMVVSPDLALQVWQTLPDAIKAMIPPQYMPLIGVALFVSSIISRAIKQQKLTK